MPFTYAIADLHGRYDLLSEAVTKIVEHSNSDRPATIITLGGSSAPVDIQPRRADVPPRQADVGPPPPTIAVPPRAPGIEAAPHPLDVQSPPAVQSTPVAPADIQPRPVVGVDPPPRTSEIPRPPMPVGTVSPEIK